MGTQGTMKVTEAGEAALTAMVAEDMTRGRTGVVLAATLTRMSAEEASVIGPKETMADSVELGTRGLADGAVPPVMLPQEAKVRS